MGLCWRRQLAFKIKISINPQLLPCPGGCRAGLGQAGSTVGLSPSRGPCGHLPRAGTPQSRTLLCQQLAGE